MLKQKMPVTFNLVVCIIVLFAWYPLLSHGDPDPMARPTRPKVFTSADELRRYLDLVKDYYSLNGKARYGKRAQIMPVTEEPWEVVGIPSAPANRFVLRQQHLEQSEKVGSPAKHQLQKEVFQRLGPRPFQQDGQLPLNYFIDVMAKYYDELQ